MMGKKKKSKNKQDLIAIALYHLACRHYREVDKYVEALHQHYGIKEDDQADVDIWSNVIDDDDFSKMLRELKASLKRIAKDKKKS